MYWRLPFEVGWERHAYRKRLLGSNFRDSETSAQAHTARLIRASRQIRMPSHAYHGRAGSHEAAEVYCPARRRGYCFAVQGDGAAVHDPGDWIPQRSPQLALEHRWAEGGTS